VTGRRAPFLFTLDVHSRSDLAAEVTACLDKLANVGIRGTFFVPATLVGETGVTKILKRLVREGHQVGCHGLLHREPENFASDPLEVQIRNVKQAKDMIEAVIDQAVTVFRAPSFVLSAQTMVALDTCGYKADLSVNSQRLSLISSQVGNVQWLTAPRRPYHPSHSNPYVPGDLDLWEIPVTAFGLPFISTMHQALGLRFTRMFARLMIRGARLLNHPIVYMAHPEEFYPSTYVRPRTYHFGRNVSAEALGWRLLVPKRNAGFRIRWLLYECNEDKIYRDTLQMMEFLADRHDVEFMTVDEYRSKLEGSLNGAPLRKVAKRDGVQVTTN
jgi:hypothetical protein